MRSPIIWFGGKGNMIKKLLSLTPPHEHYVEPFCGGASLFFAKAPSAGVETLNDINGDIVNLYRVLRDSKKFKEFERLAHITPFSREEFETLLETYMEYKDDVERAWKWWAISWMSFSGKWGESWGFSVSTASKGMSSMISKFLTSIDGLPEVHSRLIQAQIEHSDFRKILKHYNAPGTLCYCDPPYIHETRKSYHGYEYEMTEDDHKELVDLLLKYPAMVMLSCYNHPCYLPLEEAGWTQYNFDTVAFSTARTRVSGFLGKGALEEKQKSTETIYLNQQAEVARARPKQLALF